MSEKKVISFSAPFGADQQDFLIRFVERKIEEALDRERRPKVRILALPGGQVPKRLTSEAVGYNAFIRAVVSSREMDAKNPNLRRTLFDFLNYPEDPDVAGHVHSVESNGELTYRMQPHESVLVGIGFVTELPPGDFYWVAPRSGLAAKWGITVTNAPGTVDSDYRGEAGVLVYNRNSTPFDLRRGMRIAQVIFGHGLFPEFEHLPSFAEFGKTERGVGGFGSTGLK